MVKFQSYLAGCVFALLLTAHIAMVLLDAYPSSGYLWRVNMVFAREVRPLLEHIERLAGGSSVTTIFVLSGLAGLAVISARRNLRLLGAANCHIAFGMLLLVVVKSYVRIHPPWLSMGLGDLPSILSGLNAVQYGMLALLLIVAAACVAGHVLILGHAFELRRRRILATQSARLRA